MPKRNLRVAAWLGTTAVGVCAFCDWQFKVRVESMIRWNGKIVRHPFRNRRTPYFLDAKTETHERCCDGALKRYEEIFHHDEGRFEPTISTHDSHVSRDFSST
jgi:hypothetical protein